MAISFVNSSEAHSNAADSLTVSIPGGLAVGDLMVAAVAISGDNRTVTPPSGWTAVDGAPITSGMVQGGVWYRYYQSGDSTANWSFVANPPLNTKASVTVSVYRGVDQSTPFVQGASAGKAGSSNQLVAPSVTATGSDQVLLGVFLSRGQDVDLTSAPSGMTQRAASVTTGGGAVTSHAFDQAINSAGSTGTRTATYNIASGAGYCMLLALNAGTPPPSILATGAWGIPLAFDTVANLPFWGMSAGRVDHLTAVEAAAGRSVGARRSFWQGTTAHVNSSISQAASDIAAGRVPWFSYKLPGNWASVANGNHDAWAHSICSGLGALNGPIMLTWHHEPEHDEPNIMDWVAMSDHLYTISKQYPNIRTGPILTGWNQVYGPNQQFRLNNLWPGEFKSGDFIAFDPYNPYGSYGTNGTYDPNTDIWTPPEGATQTWNYREQEPYYNHLSEFAKRKGIKWAIGEFGIGPEGGQYAVDNYGSMNFFSNAWNKAIELGDCLTICYFNTAYNSTVDWRITHDPVRLNPWLDILAESPQWRPNW